MNRIHKILRSLLIIVASSTAMALSAQPVFRFEFRNDVQIAPNIYQFDIYLLAQNAGDFELATCQMGIIYNGTDIKNGGTFSATIVSGSSELVAAQQPTVINSATANCLKIAAKTPPGTGAGTIISHTSPGTRVCTVRLTNTQPFTPGKKVNLSWNFTTIPYPSKVNAYVPAGGGTNVQVVGLGLNENYCTTNNLSNPMLNAWNALLDNDWSNPMNWSPPSIPTTLTNAYLPAAAPASHITMESICQNLIVENGATLIVEGGQHLTVTGTTNLNGANALIIKGDANGQGSFIDNGFTGSGTAQFEKFLPASNPSGWTVSAPVANADASVFAGAQGVFQYNPLIPGWQSYTSGPLAVMKGYWTKFATNKTLEFTNSNLNTGTIIFSNFYRTAYLSGNMGWNFIGNPYPSSINWDDVIDINGGYLSNAFLNQTKLNSAVYIENNGSYSSYVSGIGTNGFNGVIPPATAFWVQVNKDYVDGINPVAASSLVLNNSVRVHAAPGGSKKSYDADIFRLSLVDAHRTDETVISIRENSTPAFEPLADAEKMMAEDNSVSQIYSLNTSGEVFSINTTDLSALGMTLIPIGFTATTGTANKIKSVISETSNRISDVYLEDKKENRMINLRIQDEYTFTSLAQQDNNRFVLHLGNAIASVTEDVSVSEPIVYTSMKMLYVKGADDFNTIIISNILGQTVYAAENSDFSGFTTVDMSAYPVGNYIVTLSGRTSVFVKKVLVQ